jgi:hypothetical protein
VDTDLQSKAMSALVNMHTAIKNVQLYPPTSPTVTTSIERLYLQLLDVLRQEAPLVFAESEKKILLRGKLLNQKEHEMIHVTSLLDILLQCGVKSISFDKGLEREELNTFIRLLAKKPETIQNEGGLPKLMAENKITHIYPDKKVYVSMDKDKEVIASVDIDHDQSIESPASAEDQGSDDPAGQAISRLTEDILNEQADLRAQASSELVKIIESLSFDRQRGLIERLSERLVEWIKLETSVTPAYKKICNGLQTLLQDLLSRERFAETIPIMDVFSKIHTGALKKDDPVIKVSLEVLRNTASEYNIHILFKEFTTNEKNKSAEAYQILAGFGDIILSPLLDIVRDVTDSKERVNVIHLIVAMGQTAIPAIKDRMNADAPWYYLRNLAYILGHIGNETSAHILVPLLLHKNDRVSMEALKSIGQTGGSQRGPLLLSVLPQVNEQLRINIIEMLGKVKCAKAVTNLVDMLKNKSLLASDEYISLQEKVCNALGAIGSPEAIPALSEIAESKSFLGIRSCPVEIKYAAKRALASIKRKQEENTGR